jgi:serine/threonine-protein kinase
VTTSLFLTSPEAKAFYQSRVASFGLIIAAAGAIGFGFRIIIGLATGTFLEKMGDPGYLLHASAIVPCMAMWLVCRGGPRSLATVIAAETMGLLFASVAYIGMGMTIPPEVGADVITAFTISFAFFARAVFVPSTARHTAWLGLIIGFPLVGMMALHYRDVDPAMWRMVGYDTRGFELSTIILSTALMTTMWWTLTVGLSSIASYVIHRLRSEVSGIRSLGQYQLERKLGEGAMGVVYQATHGMLKRPTAVKLLRPELGGREVYDLFRREVQLTATLKHPHTITIYDYGRTPEGLFYYAMELLEGASLQDVVRAYPARRGSRSRRSTLGRAHPPRRQAEQHHACATGWGMRCRQGPRLWAREAPARRGRPRDARHPFDQRDATLPEPRGGQHPKRGRRAKRPLCTRRSGLLFAHRPPRLRRGHRVRGLHAACASHSRPRE